MSSYPIPVSHGYTVSDTGRLTKGQLEAAGSGMVLEELNEKYDLRKEVGTAFIQFNQQEAESALEAVDHLLCAADQPLTIIGEMFPETLPFIRVAQGALAECTTELGKINELVVGVPK